MSDREIARMFRVVHQEPESQEPRMFRVTGSLGAMAEARAAAGREMAEHARGLARQRWDKPEVIEERVQGLAAHIRAKLAKLPPLTEEQKQHLTGIING